MTTITKERIELFIKSPLENGLTRGEQMELARIALVSLDAEPVSQPYKFPEEKGASLQLRNLIRKRHAEWSDSTFGNVGPVGPLKHLSKEALEASVSGLTCNSCYGMRNAAPVSAMVKSQLRWKKS